MLTNDIFFHFKPTVHLIELDYSSNDCKQNVSENEA